MKNIAKKVLFVLAWALPFNAGAADKVYLHTGSPEAGWKLKPQASFPFVVRPEKIGVQRIGYTHNLLSDGKGALARLFLQPMTACDEGNGMTCINFLLLAEDAIGKVVLAFLSIEEGAFATLLPIAATLACMVTDARTGPHVVHGPYNRFARLQYLADVLQR